MSDYRLLLGTLNVGRECACAFSRLAGEKGRQLDAQDRRSTQLRESSGNFGPRHRGRIPLFVFWGPPAEDLRLSQDLRGSVPWECYF